MRLIFELPNAFWPSFPLDLQQWSKTTSVWSFFRGTPATTQTRDLWINASNNRIDTTDNAIRRNSQNTTSRTSLASTTMNIIMAHPIGPKIIKYETAIRSRRSKCTTGNRFRFRARLWLGGNSARASICSETKLSSAVKFQMVIIGARTVLSTSRRRVWTCHARGIRRGTIRLCATMLETMVLFNLAASQPASISRISCKIDDWFILDLGGNGVQKCAMLVFVSN